VGAGEVDLGPVVDDTTEVPDALAGGLELGEVGLPQPVATCWRGDERLPADAGELTDLAGVARRQAQPVAAPRPVHRRVGHRTGVDVVDPDALELGVLLVVRPNFGLSQEP